MEKTQQYYIDEFYKFLESKEQGLSERFNGLCDTPFEEVDGFLNYVKTEKFLIQAFTWYHDDEFFWSDLHDQWLLHLEQL